jgi:hypothetical protein
MSDKYLRERAAKSDTKMRPTPIHELHFDSYYKCERKETVVYISLKSEEQNIFFINKIDFAQDGGGRFNMLGKLDKRADERFPSNAAIIFSIFSTKNWHENRSMTLNLSAGGMCFEFRHSVKPGADLYIRAGQNPETVSGICNWNLLRISTLAEVRWCREITRGNGTSYGIGVKYF